MPETKDEEENRKLRELEGKNIAHYQVLLSAWIGTRMERDKTVITISSAAIALLVTIITTVGVTGFWQYFFVIVSFMCFIAAIFCCWYIYQVNADHLEKVINKKDDNKTDKLLENLDVVSAVFFYLGVLCAISMALLISFQKTGGVTIHGQEGIAIQKMEGITIQKIGGFTMIEKKPDTSKKEKLQESLKGVKKLLPDLETAGFHGINDLAPQQNPAATTTPTTPATPVTPATNSQNTDETNGNAGKNAKGE